MTRPARIATALIAVLVLGAVPLLLVLSQRTAAPAAPACSTDPEWRTGECRPSSITPNLFRRQP